MKLLTQFKTTIRPVRKPEGSVSAGFLIPLLLVCFGLAPMAQAVGPDTEGSIPGSNNGEGIGVLASRTTGVWNTGTGFEALNHLTSGNQNTATGLRALNNDINGGFNTATGVYSLFANTSGFFNSATGAYSLANNISGTHNTANGYAALYRNADADDNTATGYAALYHDTTGVANTATGVFALFNNTIGSANSAFGAAALGSNTTGFLNTAVGDDALFSNTSGSANIAIGLQAGTLLTTGDHNIDIGHPGVAGESATIRIGATGVQTTTYIAGIAGQTVGAGGSTCYVDNDGKLGVFLSARRFKTDIADMAAASEALLALRPVTFHYKPELDKLGIPQFGLVAEEVAKVNPDLVTHDAKGDIYTVRYEAVNVMLLNEFLKEHGKVEKLEAAVTQQRKDFQSTIAQQQKSFQSRLAEEENQIEAMASSLQKVTAQIETTKPARKVAVNNP
ncbi:MAG: hypothetical protein DMG85_08150 [Acidobacteria bacterium]|nr:MAG: hypothetical protein DMG85_08150 [Acidobacteriota bacterium]TMP91016.1 MAG: hypothetical protein E6L08_12015 [Verrucomicrobiota bacterium]